MQDGVNTNDGHDKSNHPTLEDIRSFRKAGSRKKTINRKKKSTAILTD